MRWHPAWSLRKTRLSQLDSRMFGPGENPSAFGTPNVSISGESPKTISIPGVEGTINLDVSIQTVKEALERAFGADYFLPITNITVKPMSGKFGLTESTEPHTIFIDENAMINSVKNAVQQEANTAAQNGIKAEFTPEIGNKINEAVAKLLWETIPHEREHALDFQEEIKKMFETGKGDVSSVPESHGEQAGKAALGRFKWWGPPK